MDGITHPSTKVPWLILVLAIFGMGGMGTAVNSYQAEGGWAPKTWAVGMAIQVCSNVLIWTLIAPICAYAFFIYFGYMVMQKSK